MSDYGMKFMQEGKSLKNNRKDEITYDSTNDTLQVDITQLPPHIDLIDPLKQASVFTVTVNFNGDYQYREEILLQIEHHLPFKPDFTCYFYCIDSPFPADIGNYRLDYYRIGFGGEYFIATTDETYFYIKHTASVRGAPSIPPTYPYTYTLDSGNKMRFRVKYMIHPMPDLGFITYTSS